MKFIAHDPYADTTVAAELGIELVGLEDLFARSDIPYGQLPADAARRTTSSMPSGWR